MNDQPQQEMTTGNCLSQIFQVTIHPDFQAKKGKGYKTISDLAILGQRLLVKEQVKNSADLAALSLVVEKALQELSLHCPAEVIKEFEAKWTERLKDGSLQQELMDDLRQKQQEVKGNES